MSEKQEIINKDDPVDKRIYIGGLHPSTTEDQIKERFSKFGSVDSVTIAKNVENECRGFGHMTIHTTPKKWETCLSVYNGSKWRGLPLKLEEAKMDWQEKKRQEEQKEVERQEKKRKRLLRWNDSDGFHAKDMSLVTDNNMGKRKGWKRSRYGRAIAVMRLQKPDGTKFVFEPTHYKNNLLKLYNIGGRMKPVSRLISRIDEEFTDDEEELPQLYQQQQDDEEEEDGEQVDHKDSKITDDEKRKAAMEKMFEEQRQRKEQLSKALAETKQSHTKFDNDEDEDDTKTDNMDIDTPAEPLEGAKWMFDSDESEDEFNIEINPVLEGEQGRKRLELQTKFKGDERFKLGDDFIEEGEDKAPVDTRDDISKELGAEKDQAMDVLRAMFGDDKVDSKPKVQSNTWSGAARFDPDAEESSKYLADKPVEEEEEDNNDEEDDDDDDFFAQKKANTNSAIPTVSTDKHFAVNTNLKPLFGGAEEAPFSLFGGEPAEKPKPLFSSKPEEDFFIPKKQEGRIGLGVMFFFHLDDPSLNKKSCYAYDADGVFQEKPEEKDSYETKWRTQRPIIKEVLKKRQRNAVKIQKRRANKDIK